MNPFDDRYYSDKLVDSVQEDSFDLSVTSNNPIYSSIRKFNEQETSSPPTEIESKERIFGEHILEAAQIIKGLFVK